MAGSTYPRCPRSSGPVTGKNESVGLQLTLSQHDTRMWLSGWSYLYHGYTYTHGCWTVDHFHGHMGTYTQTRHTYMIAPFSPWFPSTWPEWARAPRPQSLMCMCVFVRNGDRTVLCMSALEVDSTHTRSGHLHKRRKLLKDVGTCCHATHAPTTEQL